MVRQIEIERKGVKYPKIDSREEQRVNERNDCGKRNEMSRL